MPADGISARPAAADTPRAGLPRRIVYRHQGDVATFLQTSEESGGARTLLELEVAPGGRVTPHFDIGYAEHFRGRQGRLGLQIGEQTRTLGPGEEALAQPGQLHAWRNDASEPAVAVVELRPGHAGSEKALCVAYRLAADGMPRNPLHAALPLQ